MKNGTVPIVIGIGPSSVRAGGNVQVTVRLDEVTQDDLDLTITSTGSFSSLPSTVTVRAGDESIVFYGTVSSSATGSVTVTAEANGVSVTSSPMQISSQ